MLLCLPQRDTARHWILRVKYHCRESKIRKECLRERAICHENVWLLQSKKL